MKLTRLALSGFKSFAVSVDLAFDEGVTAIVGPNGCGKSNISDAVRWVLGEQRTRMLRGLRMEDIIFHGSAKRKPVSLADVSLIFDNGDGTLPIAYHEVAITRPYYMGAYLVTQRQYELVMDQNPAYFTPSKGGGPDFPVENISWEDANEFCRRLSALPAEKSPGRLYRLPTEAEWEYACRANVPMPFSSGPTLSSREANFNGNYPYGMTMRGPYLERTSRVGSYAPNPFGLHDMHGNVWEWCSDYYDRTYYRNSPSYDPQGPLTGTLRVVRGGSCLNIGRFCRSAYRFGVTPTNRDLDVGLRVVMTLKGMETPPVPEKEQ